MPVLVAMALAALVPVPAVLGLAVRVLAVPVALALVVPLAAALLVAVQ